MNIKIMFETDSPNFARLSKKEQHPQKRIQLLTLVQLKIPSNISLLFLPPYSPELNPIEQLWCQLKHKWLANRCFDDYLDIINSTAYA